MQTGMFWHNGTKGTRELQFILSGGNASSLTLVGIYCEQSCPVNPPVIVRPLEVEYRYWSDATNWPNETLPAAGENVTIESGWNMILDVAEPAEIANLTINGRLTFQQGLDVKMRARNIFIRAGEMHIGSAAEPHTGTVLITLTGVKSFDETLWVGRGFVNTNKAIVNLNKLRIYGQPRLRNWFRLLAPAKLNDTSLLVPAGLDLKEWDVLGLLPTSYAHNHGENVTVKSYNASSGEVQLWSKVQRYHWGAPESTAAQWAGVDMRGEVLLLTRNVKIQGEYLNKSYVMTNASFGCSVLTADFVESDLTFRYGSVVMSNVELENCGQGEAQEGLGAVHVRKAAKNAHVLKGLSVHHGQGAGIRLEQAKQATVTDNVVFWQAMQGIYADSVISSTISNNVVGNIISFAGNFTEGGAKSDGELETAGIAIL